MCETSQPNFEKEKVIAVVGIVTDGSKVLIGKLYKAKMEEFGGLPYVFPGGRIEEAEDNEQATVREVLEETGYEVFVVKKIGRRMHPSTNILMEYYHCKVDRGKLSTESERNDDIEKLLWVELDEIKEYMPTLFDEVKKYLEGLEE